MPDGAGQWLNSRERRLALSDANRKHKPEKAMPIREGQEKGPHARKVPTRLPRVNHFAMDGGGRRVSRCRSPSPHVSAPDTPP